MRKQKTFWHKQFNRFLTIDVATSPLNSAKAMAELFGITGRIDGIDGAENMRQVAMETFPNLFTEYHVKFVTKDSELPLQKNFYDLALSVASFGARTIENVCITKFLDHLKPGGHFAILAPEMAFSNPYKGEQPAIAQLIERWESDGLLKLVFTQKYPNYWRNSTGVAILLQRTP